MSRSLVFVYDDSFRMSDEAIGIVGVERFGDLLFQRRPLSEHVLSAAEAARFTEVHHLKQGSDRRSFFQELGQRPHIPRVVYLTSELIVTSPSQLQQLLGKLSFAEDNIVGRPKEAPPSAAVGCFAGTALLGLLSCRTQQERAAWLVERAGEFHGLDEPSLISISSIDTLVAFLANSFYTRSFNQIQSAQRTITKRSADIGKMKREHDFWYALPPQLQRFVVQPYGYRETEDGAEYTMERLGVPDLSILWVHGVQALPEEHFDQLLEAIFGWFSERDTMNTAAAAHAIAETLYIDKVSTRIDSLLASDTGQTLDRLLRSGTNFDGLTGLRDTYIQMVREYWNQHGVGTSLAVTHGDLCFSNILYDKRSGLLRFIDPRGVDEPSQIYSHPYYDIAKLSHSILGGYDFVNGELFDVYVGDTLQLELRRERYIPDQRQTRFIQRVESAGFDPIRMRLYEASLFISMLPLHTDHPRKLIAFSLIAADILEQLQAKPASQTWMHWMGLRASS